MIAAAAMTENAGAKVLPVAVMSQVINLHHHRTPCDAVPTLTRDYRVEACVDGSWQTLASVADNRHRHRIHDVAPVRTASW